MHDIKQIRINADYLVNTLCKRGYNTDSAKKIINNITSKDKQNRKLQFKKQIIHHTIKKISTIVHNNSNLFRFLSDIDLKNIDLSSTHLTDLISKILISNKTNFFIILPDDKSNNIIKLMLSRLEYFSFIYLSEIFDNILQQIKNKNNFNEEIIKNIIDSNCKKYNLEINLVSKYSLKYLYNFNLEKIKEVIKIFESDSTDKLDDFIFIMMIVSLIFNTINMLFYKSLDDFSILDFTNIAIKFIEDVNSIFINSSLDKINNDQLNFFIFIKNFIGLNDFCKVCTDSDNQLNNDYSIFFNKKTSIIQKRILTLTNYSKHLSKFLLHLNQQDDSELIKYELSLLPNILDESVPNGSNENDNTIIKKWGDINKKNFIYIDHQNIAEKLGMMDSKRAVRMSGERFVIISGDLARLERALIAMMLDVARDNGYYEVSTPLMVSGKAMLGTGQLPKFGADSYIATTESAIKNFAKKFLFEICNYTQKHIDIGDNILNILYIISNFDFDNLSSNYNSIVDILKKSEEKKLFSSDFLALDILKKLCNKLSEKKIKRKDVANLISKIFYEYIHSNIDKFADSCFDKNFFLNELRNIPTAEVSLTSLRMNDIIDSKELPIRLTAVTPCFRSEAGSAGKDTYGMIRLHQFYKVELVSLVKKNNSEQELERMTNIAESILEKLELPYRRVLLCGGDVGFSAAKTYDLEVWFPSQDKYREVSSCSNCKDFQARRMNTRYKESKNKEYNFVHTLNGSALAVGRTIAAILENFQNSDGYVKIPLNLRKYMNNIEYLK